MLVAKYGPHPLGGGLKLIRNSGVSTPDTGIDPGPQDAVSALMAAKKEITAKVAPQQDDLHHYRSVERLVRYAGMTP